MRQLCLALAIVVTASLWPATAMAQRRPTRRPAPRPVAHPHEGSNAVGIDIGGFFPRADGFAAGPLVGGFWQNYLTPRVSIRALVSVADPGLEREPEDSVRQIPIQLSLNYNWERVRWHPFVGAGVGAYLLRAKDNGEAFGDTKRKAGLDIEGGLEYFFRRDVTVKGEIRYQGVKTPAGFPDPSGLVVTGGIKKYF